MTGEREIFTRLYVGSMCLDLGVHLFFVDLRCGVTIDQATNGEVVNICLRCAAGEQGDGSGKRGGSGEAKAALQPALAFRARASLACDTPPLHAPFLTGHARPPSPATCARRPLATSRRLR